MFRARNQRLLGEFSGASGRPGTGRPPALFPSGGIRRGAFGARAAATRSLRRSA